MILESLVTYYERLVNNKTLPEFGWSRIKISFAIDIDENGEIMQFIDLRESVLGRTTSEHSPREMVLPSAENRSSNIISNFLWDNSSYILGMSSNINKQKDDHLKYKKCKEKHESILKDVEDPFAKAIINYFKKMDLNNENRFNGMQKEILEKSVNLTFRFKGRFANEDSAIKEAYEKYIKSKKGDQSICSITGKRSMIEVTHPKIKGAGGQSAGTNLVSFNVESSESFGKKQGFNAPISVYAAHAYTSALNYLVSDKKHCQRLGDTVIVYWAETGETQYQDLFSIFWDENNRNITDNELSDILESLCSGNQIKWDDELLDPTNDFYILGIYPNNARQSVKFFYYNSFGYILENVKKHYEDIKIGASYDNVYSVNPFNLAVQTALKKEKKAIKPRLIIDLLEAIIYGTPYPNTLFNGVMIRLRAGDILNKEKAGIIKGYLIRNLTFNNKEVLTVSLNRESDYKPYVLGRVFCILEEVQKKSANTTLNTTIKDKYFNSAAATPGIVFPTLIKLSKHHFRKMKQGNRLYYEKKLEGLLDKIDCEFPKRFSLTEQGSFQLGYYHQKNDLFEKKSINNVKEEEEQ